MNAFFQQLLKPTPVRPPHKPPSSGSRLESDSIEDSSESATRRQLVQVLLRDILRKSGIPAGWIDCQMMVVSSRTRGTGAFLRLTIRHWDERLMRYMFALQKELLKDILGLDPAAESWLHGISWQLEVGSTCTLTKLPEKAYWQNLPALAPLDVPEVAIPVPEAARPAPAALTPAKPAAPGLIPASTSSGAAAPVTSGPAITPAAAAAVATTASTLAARRAARAAALPAAGQVPAPRPAMAEPLSSQLRAAALEALVPTTLDYGAVDFESSRPAQETELTDDLARLFALRDEEWKQEITKHVSSVGYEQTRPGGS